MSYHYLHSSIDCLLPTAIPNPARRRVDFMYKTALITVAVMIMAGSVRRANAQSLPVPADIADSGPTGVQPVPVHLETALQWTLARNPMLVALRQDRRVSAAAWEAARRIPMSINPTVSVEVRPWTYDGTSNDSLDTVIGGSIMQPLQFGHPNQHRAAIGRADYRQTDWRIAGAELTALVQTYRRYETAVYRREKLKVARELADFNQQLVASLRRQVQAGQAGADDLVLAEVQNQATVQQWRTADQSYGAALADLRRQMALPDVANTLIPDEPLLVPAEPDAAARDELIQRGRALHPAVLVAQAQLAAAQAALCLARANRIPNPSIGPVYESDESGTTFYGLAVSTPIYALNTGLPRVRQREAEYRRGAVQLASTQDRIAAQIDAALQNWLRTRSLIDRVLQSTLKVEQQADQMQHLFAAGQTDLVRLLQVRQSLMQVQNARLDMSWQATQAYADLLAATGINPLLPGDEPAVAAD